MLTYIINYYVLPHYLYDTVGTVIDKGFEIVVYPGPAAIYL